MNVYKWYKTSRVLYLHHNRVAVGVPVNRIKKDRITNKVGYI